MAVFNGMLFRCRPPKKCGLKPFLYLRLTRANSISKFHNQQTSKSIPYPNTNSTLNPLQQYATMPSRPRSTPPTKRRKILMGKQPAEILFDTAAREDYLTGFHKRKLQRIKQAQELAKEAAKEEKKVHRREVRESLFLWSKRIQYAFHFEILESWPCGNHVGLQNTNTDPNLPR